MTAFCLVAFVLRSALPASATEGNARLRAAIERALAANPDLLAMEARIDAARARVPQAAILPDPEVEVGIKDIPPSSWSLNKDDFTMEMLTARQQIPGLGKRGARRASAAAAAENVAAQHGGHAVTIAADVADSFFMLAGLDRRLEILERSRDRLKSVSASATERYRVGKGPQSDVLHANLEVTAFEDRLLQLRSERRTQAARFNALQNLPTKSPVRPINEFEIAQPAKTTPEIAAEAEQRSPAVVATQAAVRRAEEELRLANLERRPDITLAAYYAHRERFEDLAGASVSFNLPFTHPHRLDQRKAEMEAELSAAKADLESVRNELRYAIDEAAAALDRNLEQEKLYRTSILPQAEINFRATQEAYAVGQIDFETFVRATLDLDTYEGEIAMRVSGIGRAIAALQKASGLPLIEGTPESGENHVEK